MNSVLIDTNAYSAFKQRNREALEIVQHADRIGVSVIVLGELLHGFALGTRADRNRHELDEFLKSPIVEIVDVDQVVAEQYSAIKLQLRNLGKAIPINDLWIAATAIAFGFALNTYDSHFRFVPGLKVVSKLSELV